MWRCGSATCWAATDRVIPLFEQQIRGRAGRCTVTHPDIIRYFMTIPEAVSLVLQAGAYALRAERSSCWTWASR